MRAISAEEIVLGTVRTMLLNGDIAPGDRIDQRAMAELVGCSVVPVREALQTLSAEGQIIHRPQRGYFAAELDIAELNETYRIREIIEEEAVRAAVARIGQAELDNMRSLDLEIRSFSAAGDLIRMLDANRRLHFALYDASAMPRLVNLIRIMWDLTERYRANYYHETANRERVNSEHSQILKALEDKDVERVLILLREHRDHTIADFEGHLSEK